MADISPLIARGFSLTKPLLRGAQAFGQIQQNKLDALAGQNESRARQLLPAAVAGNQDALSELAGINLDAAAKVQEFQAKRKKGSRDETKFQQEQSAQSLARIVALDPEEQPAAYAEERERLIEGGLDPKSLPKEFDSGFIESSISMAQQAGFLKTAKPIEIFDPTSPTGSRFVRPGEAVGQPGKARSGIEVTTPDGTTVKVGGTPDLSKPTSAALEKKQIQAADQLARVKDIEKAFKPEFLEIGTRLGAAFTAGKAKLGLEIDEADRKSLTDFATFKRRTIDNINKLLNELSGAAVSPQEAERLRASMPDAGDGIFDGDNPIDFEAKMNDVLGQLKLSFIRLEFARKNNLDALTLSLSDMEDTIERRGEELLEQVGAERPDLPREALMLDVTQRLLNEFGDFR